MGSQFHLSSNLGSPHPDPLPSLSHAIHDSHGLQLSLDGKSLNRPRPVPAIPPGFEGFVPTPKHDPRPSEMGLRVALLEHELQIRQVQLMEANRNISHLTKLQREEAERVFVLVQELAHCERRTAKAEITVEYLLEVNFQIAAEVRQHEEPNTRISILEEQLQRANRDAETRISVLEMEIQDLSQESEKLKSKLENAMDTILALSSMHGRNFLNQASAMKVHPIQTLGAAVQHNNLIDLMDGCLTPIKTYVAEEQTTTLLDDSYDPPEEEQVSARVAAPQTLSDSFDSDFSNSSYIVRFKGIRDMSKESIVVQTPVSSFFHKASNSSLRSKTDTKESLLSTLPNDGHASSGSSSPRSRPVFSSRSPNGNSTHPTPEHSVFFKDGISTQCMESKPECFSAKQTKAMSNWADPRELLTFDNITPAHPLLHASANLPGSGRLCKLNKVDAFPLFKDMASKERAIQNHKRNCSGDEFKYPDFFKYGIIFNPDPDERNVYRTVLISNIPLGVSLCMVLNQVRGGMVLDAKLLDTQSIIGSQSALVTFVHEHAAMCYEEYAAAHSIGFKNSTAKVNVLPTPTWPMPPRLHKSITNLHHSRCLEVHNFPKIFVLPQVLDQDLRLYPYVMTENVVYKHMGKEKPVVLKLHFSSVDYAGRAFNMFLKSERYKYTTPRFVPDPCAQPLEAMDEEDQALIESLEESSHASPVLARSHSHPAEALSKSSLNHLQTFPKN